MFSDNLKYLREKNNMSQIELATKLGRKSTSSISEWEKGKYQPKAGVLSDIAHIFNVNLDDLMNKDLRNENEVSSPKLDVLSIFNQLNLKRRRAVLKFAVKQLDEQRQENKNVITFPNKHNTTTIDVDGVLSAGVGEYLDDNSEPFSVTVPAPVPDNYDYAFKINGSSMEPYYHDGQVVFIKKVGQYRDGQTVAAIYDGCAYLKRLAVDDDGYATLVSLNPDYPNVRIDDKEGMKLLGVAFS
ncbi:XRE family transcriptional regulator [Levilactobacillus brevis]|uniref:XRE family transcriptional regulator n=1 Tax=Levilactobacillus brevis TaxID=1580 RepID=A0AB38X9H5_LEVBR|nr:XRE family transcriptional regulator [Levilactobacillus brevis]MBU7539396.1 LexA family transcriptional regulator [Levilactobacillus brevis]MBU7565623.1 LexA family transcriptional regulator [Levilactobacillus brevis]MCE6038142.1 XRE family transcriptional regulator [Levilactobacillus brevis]WAD03141.1 XRE family transcriptional regulator [Levilactobacillus brevis]